jgi:hypothetical protein
LNYPKKLSPEFSGALRTFGFWIANNSVDVPLLEGIDYRKAILEEPSLLEMALAIFANVIELDENGVPTNAKYAEHRAAQYIRAYCDPSYEITPALEQWEMQLNLPQGEDVKPWPSGSSPGK